MLRFPLPYVLITATMLLVLGVVLPFLMMVRVIAPSFVLSFVSFAATVSGAFLGYIGIIVLFAQRRQGPPW